MNFEEVLDQAMAMLRRRGRVSYRTLALQFHLDAGSLEALKEALIEVHQLAVDQDGKLLVWIGEVPPSAALPPPDTERRRLTVLVCDLVGSPALPSQLAPVRLREVS